MTTWALIPCSKSKADQQCTAQEMYWPSALFRGAFRVAEAKGEVPVILSAKYGFLLPGNVIRPYDETLIGKSRLERGYWAEGVFRDMASLVKPGDQFVSYLGAVYAEDVVRWLRVRGWVVEEPLRGLGQGKRLAWFKEQLKGGVPDESPLAVS